MALRDGCGRRRLGLRFGLPSRTFFASILLAFCFVQIALAELDPVKDFCRRFGHQTALIDRKLYIDGGLINYNPMRAIPGKLFK